MRGLIAIERSLALHRAVAAHVLRDPAVLERARTRVRGWCERGTVPAPYARGWDELLAGGAEVIARRIVEPSEAMHELRQVSPFAGALSPEERWRVLRSTRGEGA